jgi:Flp pilus assembly protein TadB
MPTDPTVLGLLMGLGATLITLAFKTPTDSPGDQPTGNRPATWTPRPTRRTVMVVVGAAAAAAVWAIFQLPVLSIAAVVAVVAPGELSGRAGGTARQPAAIAETATTVARWIETVRDYLQTSATLTEAMIQASDDVQGRHRDAFARFAVTLTGAGGYERAADDLAAELDNALADKTLVALWIGNRDGGDLQAALGLLAESAQSEADNARRIEAGLAGNRRLIMIVLVLCVVILVLSLVAFRENFDIYRTIGGQAILAVGLTVIGFTWWSIWRLSNVSLPERLVVVRPHRSPSW